jgi:glycerol-3-phosphate dehydrogenase
VVWSYAGVRPLLGDEASDNPSAVTRDYLLELDHQAKQAIVLSVFGGKITTFRRLAEQAVDKLTPLLDNHHPAWTAQATLPGGDLPHADFKAFLQDCQQRYAWLTPALRERYAMQYGSRIALLLNSASSMADLGEELSPGLYEIEARYLLQHEWAQQAEDVLWRRTKLGLSANKKSFERLQQWMKEKQ